MTEKTESSSSDQDQRISVNTEFDLSELVVGSEERSVPLDQDVIRIGSKVGNDITLDDGEIASFHCEVWKQRDHHVLVNRATQQNTFVNGRPVEFCLLKPGDGIQVGDTLITTVSASGEEDDSISPEDVENLFQEEESGQEKVVRQRERFDVRPNGGTSQRLQTRSRSPSTSGIGRSRWKKGLVLQILLGLAGAIIVLVSLFHFFG